MYSIATQIQPKRKSGLTVLLKLIILISLLVLGCSSGSLPNTKTLENTTFNLEKNVAYSKSTLGLYDISSFDVYVDEHSIHVIASGKLSANNKRIAIRYTRSEDGGRHWINSVTIDRLLPESIASRGNDVQLAAKGKYLVSLWQTKGNFPAMGPMISAYSSDNGETWERGPNPAADNDGSQAYMDLIADQHGNFHAVWLADPNENGYQGLNYSRSVDKGKQWSQPITLDDSTCSCCWNTFALSPDNKLNILYRDTSPRDMSLIQSSDEGMTWQKVSVAGDFQWKFEGCPHVGGGLKYVGVDNISQLHSIVWTGAEEKSGLYHLSSNDSGQNWSTPKKLGEMAINGDIAVRDRNSVAAVWNEIEADGLSIFYTKSKNGGSTWLTPKRLTEAKHSATHPKLEATKHGFLAIWNEKTNKQPSELAWHIFE